MKKLLALVALNSAFIGSVAAQTLPDNIVSQTPLAYQSAAPSAHSQSYPGILTSSMASPTSSTRPQEASYKAVTFGIYAGLNSTRFKGEDSNGDNLSGRLGYQLGLFVRAGGRVYGQVGAEYFASSSNYYTAGDGTPAKTIRDNINIQYIQVPVYIGYKLLQSDRGLSAIRVQVGAEYANRINANSNSFNLNNSEIKSGTFNGLGQLGFDIGPLLIDLTYHHGFDNSIKAVNSTGFAGSQRRILSASVGFKF